MGLFGQSDGVDAPGTRGAYLKEGEYIVELVKHSFNPASRKDKQPLTIVEMSIAKVIDGGEASNKEGQRCSWFAKLETDRFGELTDLGKMNMGRVKAYVAELVGGEYVDVTADQVTPVMIAKMFGQEIGPDGTETPIKGWDGTDVAGIKLHLRVVEGVSERGARYTNTYWRALEPAE